MIHLFFSVALLILVINEVFYFIRVISIYYNKWHDKVKKRKSSPLAANQTDEYDNQTDEYEEV